MSKAEPIVIDHESTALANPAETAIESWKDLEWESDGVEDIAPSFPVIKIVQPTSQMKNSDKRAGEFFRSDTEEYFETLEVVPLFKKDTRAMFAEGNDLPVCASSDGITPRPNMPQWEGTHAPLSCESCPFSAWGPNDEPPPCKVSMVVLVDHDGDLAQLRIIGKSIKPFRQFVARKLAPKKLPLCSQRLTLSTEGFTKPGQKWYELRIANTALSPAEAAQYNAVLKYERGRFEQEVADADAEDVREHVSTPAPRWGDGRTPFGIRTDTNGPVVYQGRAVDPETGEVGK